MPKKRTTRAAPATPPVAEWAQRLVAWADRYELTNVGGAHALGTSIPTWYKFRRGESCPDVEQIRRAESLHPGIVKALFGDL